MLKVFFLKHVAIGTQQAVVSKDEAREMDKRRKGERIIVELRSYLRSDSYEGIL